MYHTNYTRTNMQHRRRFDVPGFLKSGQKSELGKMFVFVCKPEFRFSKFGILNLRSLSLYFPMLCVLVFSPRPTNRESLDLNAVA